MKETVNVNIASQAFTLDDDAYAVLRRYLDDIRRRLPQEDNNTMEDVEARIADIRRRTPDISATRRELDWAPRTPLIEGLRRTISYVEKELAEKNYAGISWVEIN